MLKTILLARKYFEILLHKVSAYEIILLTDNLRKIYFYTVASTPEAAFVIGGYDGSLYIDVIAQFKNNQWSKVGDLSQGRRYHGSISVGTETMVIGGYVSSSS